MRLTTAQAPRDRPFTEKSAINQQADDKIADRISAVIGDGDCHLHLLTVNEVCVGREGNFRYRQIGWRDGGYVEQGTVVAFVHLNDIVVDINDSLQLLDAATSPPRDSHFRLPVPR